MQESSEGQVQKYQRDLLAFHLLEGGGGGLGDDDLVIFNPQLIKVVLKP